MKKRRKKKKSKKSLCRKKTPARRDSLPFAIEAHVGQCDKFLVLGKSLKKKCKKKKSQNKKKKN
jgi:hypothetical protein